MQPKIREFTPAAGVNESATVPSEVIKLSMFKKLNSQKALSCQTEDRNECVCVCVNVTVIDEGHMFASVSYRLSLFPHTSR